MTPSTLLATLRTIDSMWANQKQQENALEIARQAGALYDKFEGFVVDLVKIGKKMDEAKVEYQGAMNKLVDGKGNLINSVEKLKKMGAKAKKALPLDDSINWTVYKRYFQSVDSLALVVIVHRLSFQKLNKNFIK